MNKIIKILKYRGHNDLAQLLENGYYEIDQSSTYGSYLFSLLSTVEIFVPLNNHAALVSLSKDNERAILDAFLAIYPPKAHSIEITDVRIYVDPNLEFDSVDKYQISMVTRNNLIDELLLMNELHDKLLFGKLGLIEFLKRVWTLDTMPSTDCRFKTALGDIYQHIVNNDDWTYRYLFDEYLGLLKGSDEQFLYFLEQLVHPVVREQIEQAEYLSVINRHLSKDNYKLEAYDQILGCPVYKAIRITLGVKQKVKNLIFAADGPKPEIVLIDSVSNDIQIVKNADCCLVYDLPIPETGLRWSSLVTWWASIIGEVSPTIETERTLYRRLVKSLNSKPEKLLFEIYFEKFRPKKMENLPALIPQVYLHYDPYTLQKLKGSKRLARQRMDFLILFSNHERVIIEVDGKHHYADEDVASPQRYAEMVAADRELRLAGYEIYRFGGYELQGESGKVLLEEFFHGLFRKHGLYTK